VPSQEQSYAGMEAGIYFFKPAGSLQLGNCAQLLELGYRFYFARVDKHIHILLLKGIK